MSQFAIAMMVCGCSTLAALFLIAWVKGIVHEFGVETLRRERVERELKVIEENCDRSKRLIEASVGHLISVLSPPAKTPKGKARP
jgi:hypothetical protein